MRTEKGASGLLYVVTFILEEYYKARGNKGHKKIE
jgi:hypothetical protein